MKYIVITAIILWSLTLLLSILIIPLVEVISYVFSFRDPIAFTLFSTTLIATLLLYFVLKRVVFKNRDTRYMIELFISALIIIVFYMIGFLKGMLSFKSVASKMIGALPWLIIFSTAFTIVVLSASLIIYRRDEKRLIAIREKRVMKRRR